MIAFTLFFIVPFIMGIVLSFCKFTTVTNAHWVGIANYVKAFSNKDFMNALLFTVKFTVVSVITINVISFALAYGLTRGLKGTNIFRTIFFMPNLIGGIVLGYIWQLLINGVLAHFNVTITADPKYGFWGMDILTNWQLIGYMMIIYIAGIQNIPTELIEAAEIDGAGAWEKFWKITLPHIGPIILINGIYTVVTIANYSEQAINEELSNSMFNRSMMYSLSAAMSWIYFLLVLLILAVVGLLFWFISKKENT